MSSRVLKICLMMALGAGGSAVASSEGWTAIQSRVSALEAKIKSDESEINKLIEEKAQLKDPQKANEIIQQMIDLHDRLRANVKEYDQQRSLLKYRYPEKDFKGTREYERIEVRSLEDMESQMSLNASVKRTLQKVKAQYPTEGAAEVKSKKQPAKKTAPDSLVDPVILKK